MKLPKSVREFFRKKGAQGGASKSTAKAEAARKNGKKGGRKSEVFADLMSLLAALKGDDIETIESVRQELQSKYDPDGRWTRFDVAPARAPRKEQP